METRRVGSDALAAVPVGEPTAALPLSLVTGTSDEGERWSAVIDEDTGQTLVHMVRIHGGWRLFAGPGRKPVLVRDH